MQGIEIYHYNAKNQLTHIQSGADTLRYRYDRQGNLLEEQGKANRKQYRYDTANRQTGIVVAEADGARERILQSNRYDGKDCAMRRRKTERLSASYLTGANWHRKSRKMRRSVI